MGIKSGDIVKCKVRPGRAVVEPWYKLSASRIFYDGYYVVIEIIESEITDDSGQNLKVSVCKIMDCYGRFNWISLHNLKKIS